MATTKSEFPFRPSELGELNQQATVVSLLKRYGACFAAIPNGHVRTKRQNIQATQEGFAPGMPDLLIFDAPPNLPDAVGVALEMKRKSGRSRDVRPNQRKWLRDLADRGWVPVAGYGALDAIAQLIVLGYFPGFEMRGNQIPHPGKVAKLRKLVGERAPTGAFLESASDDPKEDPCNAPG